MINREEREEVAKKLRAKYKERTMPGFFVPQDVYFYTLDYLKDLEKCLPDGESAFTVLADLIDPTCELKIQDGHACCGNCGHRLAGEYEEEEGYWCFRPYCPDCGSRVVCDDG